MHGVVPLSFNSSWRGDAAKDFTLTHTNIGELLDTCRAGSCNRQDKQPKSDYRLEARAVV
jgi:hypothetical protein